MIKTEFNPCEQGQEYFKHSGNLNPEVAKISLVEARDYGYLAMALKRVLTYEG
jgi:hypothetical protein